MTRKKPAVAAAGRRGRVTAVATPARVHASAEVEPGAVLGGATVVWRHSHVRRGARIGARCALGQSCYVGGKVVVGDGCRIQNHVSLFDGVVLGDDVFVGPSAVFTNVKRPRAAYPAKREPRQSGAEPAFAKTVVGKGATIGANATIVCGVTIGPYAMVGAGAVVTRDVAGHTIVVGAPARSVGWICRCGEVAVYWRSGELDAPGRPKGRTAAPARESARERRGHPARTACTRCHTAVVITG